MASFYKKVLLGLGVMLVLIMGLAANTYAALTPQWVEAYQGAKIVYNGKELTGTAQPYIVNSTTLVPLRMLMDSFGKNVVWDSVNFRVVIADGTSTAAGGDKDAQITALQNKVAELQNTIDTLNSKISDLEDDDSDSDSDSDISVSDIEDDLIDAFEDAGEDYFDDDNIVVSIELSGDDDELEYTIEINFEDADDYDDLKDVSESDIKSFLNAVKSEINSEINDTDYDDADIVGELIDDDNSNYYVEYEDGSYTYSWDEDEDEDDDDDDDTSTSDIEETLNDTFAYAGKNYFNDDGIGVDISLSGDEDDLAFTIELDFEDSADYADLRAVSQSKLKSFLNAVISTIVSRTDDTNYEDAEITGTLVDSDTSSYNVDYNGSSFTFSWNA